MSNQTLLRGARCSRHPDRVAVPLGCKICMRIQLEARIVRRTVRALLRAGYALRVNDGDELRPTEPTTSLENILAELMLVDDEYLEAHAQGRLSWVRFVYGNDGYDVISDYTVNLERTLKSVNDYADKMGGGR